MNPAQFAPLELAESINARPSAFKAVAYDFCATRLPPLLVITVLAFRQITGGIQPSLIATISNCAFLLGILLLLGRAIAYVLFAKGQLTLERQSAVEPADALDVLIFKTSIPTAFFVLTFIACIWSTVVAAQMSTFFVPLLFMSISFIVAVSRKEMPERSEFLGIPGYKAAKAQKQEEDRLAVERKVRAEKLELEKQCRRATGSVPTMDFSKILGNSEIKRRLKLAAEQIAGGCPAGAPLRNGILLHGEPGNGKTIFAEALAGEMALPMVRMTYGDIASKWIGEGQERIRAKFNKAIAKAPCLFFIDEVDSFLSTREGRREDSWVDEESRKTVNLLLTLLVDIRKHDVVLMAATNYIDRLDSAAIREGRFDFKIEITPPDQEARVGLLNTGVAKYASKVKVTEDVLQSVAKRWNGFSVKRILAVTEEIPSYLADMAEKGQPLRFLTFDDFMIVLRRVQGRRGATPEDVKPMSEMILPPQTLDAIEMIANRLRDPLRTEELGGSLPTGVLFYGPPGTGKTAVCKALAKDVGYAFLIRTGPDLSRDPQALEKVYAEAKELRPAIIFIDEADDLIRSREFSASTEATNKLLTLMDGVNDRVKDVIWVAATNHIDQVDLALTRGGRFTEKVPFFKPEEHQIEGHIVNWLNKRKLGMANGLTAAEIAGSMGDQSIANVEAVLQYAVNRAIGRTKGNQVFIDRDDVRAALGVVLQMA